VPISRFSRRIRVSSGARRQNPKRFRAAAEAPEAESRKFMAEKSGLSGAASTGGNTNARAGAAVGRAAFKAPGVRVLVVDDNNLNLKAALSLMNLYGIAADTASSGEEAVLAVQKAGYDMVFMDNMMPGMSGIEAAQRIRGLGKRYEGLPIVALTANAARGIDEKFLSSGLDDYLHKPIELDRLDEVLKRWIPPERIEEASAAACSDADDNQVSSICGNIWDVAEKIGFINAEVGKNRSVGVEAVYREMLELFCNKLPRECEMLESYLLGSDLTNFAILVHGMKSSLSTIGALGLSETALQLEMAAKEEDRRFCEDNLAGFLEPLRQLHTRLAEIFDRDAAPTQAGDRVYLCENAKTALNAAMAYDGDAGLDAVGKIMKYDYGAEMNDLLKEARAALKNFDFGEAARLLRKMLRI